MAIPHGETPRRKDWFARRNLARALFCLDREIHAALFLASLNERAVSLEYRSRRSHRWQIEIIRELATRCGFRSCSCSPRTSYYLCLRLTPRAPVRLWIIAVFPRRSEKARSSRE